MEYLFCLLLNLFSLQYLHCITQVRYEISKIVLFLFFQFGLLIKVYFVNLKIKFQLENLTSINLHLMYTVGKKIIIVIDGHLKCCKMVILYQIRKIALEYLRSEFFFVIKYFINYNNNKIIIFFFFILIAMENKMDSAY